MEIANEFIIIIILYIYMCFSDFVPIPETKFTLGFVCCGVVVANMLFNIGMIMSINVKDVREKCKANKLKKMQAKRVEQNKIK